MMAHRIELDSVRKNRNSSEWRNVNRARWRHLESVGDADNIRIIARLMLAEGVTGPAVVYRVKTPVFLSATVESLASGSYGKGEQPEHLRKKPLHT